MDRDSRNATVNGVGRGSLFQSHGQLERATIESNTGRPQAEGLSSSSPPRAICLGTAAGRSQESEGGGINIVCV